MLLALALFAASLTRAELIERFRAAPVTMCDGIVQVWAHCPADMRRAYQLPIAGFAADVCRSLARAEQAPARRYERPGLLIYIGDGVTNDTRVITRASKHLDGTPCLKVWLPAPGYADIRQLQIASARGWAMAVRGEDLDETAAWNLIVDANPEMRIAAEIDDLVAWRTQGVYRRGRTDEDYLALQRRILKPGFATREEILIFASRLVLYPSYNDCLFGGTDAMLEFRAAIPRAKDDLLIRYAAYRKSNELLVWGGGRGEKLAAAAEAYSAFLRELARAKLETTELEKMLDEADQKLKEAVG